MADAQEQRLRNRSDTPGLVGDANAGARVVISATIVFLLQRRATRLVTDGDKLVVLADYRLARFQSSDNTRAIDGVYRETFDFSYFLWRFDCRTDVAFPYFYSNGYSLPP